MEVVSLAGLFIMRGAAPPPSRKLTDIPIPLPVFVEAKPPLKYGARSTEVPLYSPAARIPGTLMPTFGCVSVRSQLGILRSRVGILTVTNNGGVDNEGQKSHLVLSSVVL